MWTPTQQARLDEIDAELKNLYRTKNFAPGQIDNLVNEGERLMVERDNYQKALQWSGSADPYPNGDPPDESGFPRMPGTKSFGWQPPSPLQLGEKQLRGMWDAMQSGMRGYKVEIGTKNFGQGDGMRMKSPVAESGITGGLNQLPPIMMPTRAIGLAYEPQRLFGIIPGAMMTGPSASYLQHTGNTNEATGVAELGDKPDLGPTVVEKVIYPEKLAGICSVSLEAGMDYPDFADWLPTELARSVINAESNYLINAGAEGGPSGSAFTGLLATSGTLTRAVAGGESPLDTLNKAMVDLRVGSAFCEADCCVLHPATWGALRRIKDDQGRYILDLLAGPAGLTWNGARAEDTVIQPGNVIPQGQHAPNGALWGVPVVETTQLAAGTAIVMGIKAGAAVGWTRMGMLLQWNPFGDNEWTQNYSTWRAEERISLSVPRPTAINIVTGLPTS